MLLRFPWSGGCHRWATVLQFLLEIEPSYSRQSKSTSKEPRRASTLSWWYTQKEALPTVLSSSFKRELSSATSQSVQKPVSTTPTGSLNLAQVFLTGWLTTSFVLALLSLSLTLMTCLSSDLMNISTKITRKKEKRNGKLMLA